MGAGNAPVNSAEGKKAREMVTTRSVREATDFLKHQADARPGPKVTRRLFKQAMSYLFLQFCAVVAWRGNWMLDGMS